eukprot:TRINITY_DN32104_c0_g1_i1.p1 TRINITY_DN32104_c0_g1~~TRINITY_DN32104_c0_g1_i1.p1  ORF type:complete len:287 (+),score=11.16 TRINITY_DN32104_c0_g1_i1:316-1176(+)
MGLSPKFCAHEQSLLVEDLGVHGALSLGEFCEHCCTLQHFDVFANPRCFSTWPSWPVYTCCSMCTTPSRVESLWLDVLRPAPSKQFLLPVSLEHKHSTSDDRGDSSVWISAIVTYHKAGTTLCHSLVGNEKAGPLTNFLLVKPSERARPRTLRTAGVVLHASPRRAEASAWPYFQGDLHVYDDIGGPGASVLVHLSKPSSIKEPQQLQTALANGGGRMIHILRKPSEVVISGFAYHRRSNHESWADFINPPHCLSCDFDAWRQIFQRCDFRCSYHQLLANVSDYDG